MLNGVEDGAGLAGVGGHGLFADDVAAELHGTDDVVVVGRIDGGDDDDVGARLGDHFVEVVGMVHGQRRMVVLLLQALVVPGHTGVAEVTEGDEGIVGAPGVAEGADIHAGATAGANQRVTFHGASLPGAATGAESTAWRDWGQTVGRGGIPGP